MKMETCRVALFTQRTTPLRLQSHQPTSDLTLMPLGLLDVVTLVAPIAALVRLVPTRLAARVPSAPAHVPPVKPVNGELVSPAAALLRFHARSVARHEVRSNTRPSQSRVLPAHPEDGQYPDLDSNQGPDLRRVRCIRYTIGTFPGVRSQGSGVSRFLPDS